MALSEIEIRAIVDRITDELDRSRPATRAVPEPRRSAAIAPVPHDKSAVARLGIFENVDQAVAAAREARKGIWTLEQRDRIIARQREKLAEDAPALAEQAVAETGLGNVREKTLKNRLCIERTPGTEDLHP